MKLPIASESVLSDESLWEFVPVIRVKAGRKLSASPALPSSLPELKPWEGLTRAASRKARPLRINLLSNRFQQQDFAP